MIDCDICLHPRGAKKELVTYQPASGKEETHLVCEKCVNNLVNKYFSKTNVL